MAEKVETHTPHCSTQNVTACGVPQDKVTTLDPQVRPNCTRCKKQWDTFPYKDYRRNRAA